MAGSIINALRRQAGTDNSYMEEVIDKYPGLKIGYQDITGNIRIPPRIDGEVVRSAGWITTANYIEHYYKYMTKSGAKPCIRTRYYQLSFRGRDLPFLELESIPLFEEYFNYLSHKKIRAHRRYGTKIWDISGQISHTVIVSFYRDVLGIHDKKEEQFHSTASLGDTS